MSSDNLLVNNINAQQLQNDYNDVDEEYSEVADGEDDGEIK